jgi:hypothetical protein
MKRYAHRLMPVVYESIRDRFGLPGKYRRIMQLVSERSQGRVMAGPFAGMICADATTGSHVPKLLGIYELELWPIVERCIARGYSHIIDVGAGEGYYVVGFARRMPATRVYAFDIEERAQAACREQAALNGVEDRVEVSGRCDPEGLAKLPLHDTLLVCDCEGYEGELLDPARAPGLVDCDILVELHDHLVAGVTPQLTARFAATHTIEFIDTMERDPSRYDVLASLKAWEQALAVSEARAVPMQWAFLTANRQAGRLNTAVQQV